MTSRSLLGVSLLLSIAACNRDGLVDVGSVDEVSDEDEESKATDSKAVPPPTSTEPRLAPGLPDATKCLASTPDVDGLELVLGGSTLTVSGPPELVARIEAFRARRQSCDVLPGPADFAIDWGDDPGQTRQDYSGQPRDEDGCVSLFSHRYAVEGSYVVGGYLYRGGPNGAPIPEWFARTRISLTEPSARAPAFELTTPSTSTTLTWQKDLDVGWTWTPDRPLMIEVAAIVAREGEPVKVLASDVFCPSAYVGPGKATLRFGGESYETAVRGGPTAARIRTRVFDFDGILFEKESPPVTLSAEYVKATSPATGVVAARTATVTFATAHPDCGSWRIEWGDGQAESQEVPSGTACRAAPTSVVRQHTYTTPGSFEVRIRSNELAPTKALATITPYEKVALVVP